MYRLKVRDDAGGYYRDHQGEWMGRPFDNHEDAEATRRAMPNGHEFEVREWVDAS